MTQILQQLKDSGCDIDGALARTLNDETFLLHCLSVAMEGPEFAELGTALEQNDAKAAFEYAHALKGVLGNVGLTPLLNHVVKIVEPLRAGHADHLMDEYDLLMKEKEHISGILRG